MNWYSAHIVMYLKFVDGPQDTFVAWENVVIFQAESPKAAHEKAKKKGVSEEEVSGTTTLNNRPVHMVFAGVRKIVSFEDPNSGPVDGIEVTYSKYRMKNEKDFEDFSKGKAVFLEYVD